MDKERKIYTSFHDIPPRDYMYFPKGSLDAGKTGKFSKTELAHLLISMAVLTFVFALFITRNNLFYASINGFNLDGLPYGLALSFFGVALAFFFHEITHKLMAQKHGLWAEYRMFPQGLLFAFVLGILVPFVFAAPGAVMFRGGSRDYETGRIAMAGPLANIVISGIILLLYLFIFFEDNVVGPIVGLVCLVNAFLATFNLLPFGPLDGTKILRWNSTVWIIMLIVSVTTLVTISLYYTWAI